MPLRKPLSTEKSQRKAVVGRMLMVVAAQTNVHKYERSIALRLTKRPASDIEQTRDRTEDAYCVIIVTFVGQIICALVLLLRKIKC